MQRVWLFPVVVAATTVALVASTRPSERDAEYARLDESGERAVALRGEEPLLDLTPYVDPNFGFSLAVPAGWSAVVAAESDEQMTMLEPGYAVGFESPREHAQDLFSDYLMIEIMPGRESGLFETDGSRRRPVVVDGRAAWRDELTLASGTFAPEPLAAGSGPGSLERLQPFEELIVRQAAIVGLGYTIGLYAIGEASRRGLLDDAFETMLRTFRLPHPPFEVV